MLVSYLTNYDSYHTYFRMSEIVKMDCPSEWRWLLDYERSESELDGLTVYPPMELKLPDEEYFEAFARGQDPEEGYRNWNVESDLELMQWAVEVPSDWQVGGKCTAYLMGDGRHGQLADAGKRP